MKQRNILKSTWLLVCVTIVIFLSAAVAESMSVKAKTKRDLELNKTKVTMVSGETVKLKVKSRSYKKEIVESGNWSSKDTTIATVDDQGKVTGLAAGTTTITYREYYWDYTGAHEYTAECKVKVKKGKYSLKKKSITMLEGERVILPLPDVDFVEFESYALDGYYSDIYVHRDEETGEAVIEGDYPEKAYILVKFMDEAGHLLGADRCQVTILRKGIDTTTVALASGRSYQFEVNGYYAEDIVGWSSSDEEVASVNSSGKVKALVQGSVRITLTVIEKDGEYEYNKEYTSWVYVSEPKVTCKDQNLALGNSMQCPIEGTSDYSIVEVISNKPEIVSTEGTNLYAKAKGTAVISIKVDGVKLKTKIRVTNPVVKEVMIALEKGKSKKLVLTGINSLSKPVYVTSDQKVASVSKSGKVKALKNGTSTITITVDGMSIYVPVSVCNAKVVKTLNYGVSAIGSSYSQDRRMSAGYYDCSSLAWRSYHSAGVNFGADSWAPTAAGLAEYLVKHNKAIAFKALSCDELKPGDLLFFARGDNGRYKNIYHVAVYAGKITRKEEYWYGDSTSYSTGLLLEARDQGVGLFNYWPDARNVVVVGRPTK